MPKDGYGRFVLCENETVGGPRNVDETRQPDYRFRWSILLAAATAASKENSQLCRSVQPATFIASKSTPVGTPPQNDGTIIERCGYIDVLWRYIPHFAVPSRITYEEISAIRRERHGCRAVALVTMRKFSA